MLTQSQFNPTCTRLINGIYNNKYDLSACVGEGTHVTCIGNDYIPIILSKMPNLTIIDINNSKKRTKQTNIIYEHWVARCLANKNSNMTSITANVTKDNMLNIIKKTDTLVISRNFLNELDMRLVMNSNFFHYLFSLIET